MIQMDSSIFGVIALAVGMGICAAGGLFAAQTASRRMGVDRAADETPKTEERFRSEDREWEPQLSTKEVTHD